MTVRYYSSLDTGAPILPSVSSQRFIDNLKLILKACLVDGYAEKPAAGWTVGHEHADGFSLTNDEGFINFVASGSNGVVIYLMETITDGSAALAVGANRRSSAWFDGQSTTIRHYLSSGYFSGTSASKAWAVVADDKTVTLALLGGNTSVDPNGSYSQRLHFGRFSRTLDGAPGFCAVGGAQTAGGVAQLTNNFHGNVLRNPLTGLIDQGQDSGYRLGGFADNGTYSSMNTKGTLSPHVLRFSRVAVLGVGTIISGSTGAASSAFCGLSRGLINEPALADVYASKVLPLLGVSSPTYLDRLRPLTLPGGKVVVPLFAGISTDLSLFVSLDPADWT